MALCGDGGDELYAGYERFAAGIALSKFQRLPDRELRLMQAGSLPPAPAAFPGGGTEAAAPLAVRGHPLPEAYLSWVSYVPEGLADRRYARARSPWGLRDYLKYLGRRQKSAGLVDRLLLST